MRGLLEHNGMLGLLAQLAVTVAAFSLFFSLCFIDGIVSFSGRIVSLLNQEFGTFTQVCAIIACSDRENKEGVYSQRSSGTGK